MKFRTAMRLFALGAGLASGAASAATFVVNSTADAVDANLEDGVCAAADPAACTLRAAVMQANALAGADVIDLTGMNDPLNPITLSLVGVDETFVLTPEGSVACEAVITPDASIGDLDITEDVEIFGAGPGLTVIQWAEQGLTFPAVGDRIFHIQAPPAVTVNLVSIHDLMITGGSVGIPNDLDPENPFNCEVTGEAGAQRAYQFRRFGGGIAIGSGATVALFEEAVHGGGGGGGGSGSGGGRPPGVGPGGDEGEGGVVAVALERVAVIGNASGSDAGGVDVTVETTIVDSIFSANLSNANGGGLYLDARTSITGTLIGDSTTDVPYESGPVAADLLGPNVGENGGGIFATGSHTSTIDQSALNLNSATGGGAIAGRAGVTLNITNTTVSGNVASDVGGGITTNGNVNLRNATVANNRSASDSPGGGAGLNSFGGNYTYDNTILSNNLVQSDPAVEGREANCGCTGGAPTCPPNVMVSDGFNLSDETVDTCALIAPGDQPATDPLLEALANNGGLTETHRLPSTAAGDAATSPAIDTGDNNRCRPVDQRGSPRPVDGDAEGTPVCDIGAFELSVPRADLALTGGVDDNSVTVGSDFTFDYVLTNNGEDDASTVRLTVDLPSGVTYVSATSSVGACSVSAGDVICQIGGLAVGASASIEVVAEAVTAGNGTVGADAIADQYDPDVSDNSVDTAITILAASSSRSSGGGGGGCAYNPGNSVDPTLPALLAMALLALFRRRRVAP